MAFGGGKIKVIFFDEAVAFGGSVVVLAHLFVHIDRTRFEPKLVTSLDAESLKQLFAPEDVLCRFLPILHYASRVRWMDRCPGKSALMRRIWAYLFTIAAVLLNAPASVAMVYRVARMRPDVLHANNGNDGVFVSRLLRIPMVWHIHGWSESLTRHTKLLRRVAVKFVSISKSMSSAAIERGILPSRIVDIPNPAPDFVPGELTREQWRLQHGVPKDAVVMSHVGRLMRWKGQLEFLQAFIRVAQHCPDAIALVVGDDVEGFTAEYPKQLRELVAENGLEGRVIFTGHVSNILELMSFSDVVVHSSIEPEPFGLVITEAMAAGAAVIAARLGAPIEIIEEGVTGLLVDPTNVEEFAAALELLVTDEAHRQELARAGHEMVKRRYSPKVFARQIEDVYQQIVDARTAK